MWFGSAGLFCYDLDGKLLWKRNLGEVKMGAALGEGCSPVVHNGRVIIVVPALLCQCHTMHEMSNKCSSFVIKYYNQSKRCVLLC